MNNFESAENQELTIEQFKEQEEEVFWDAIGELHEQELAAEEGSEKPEKREPSKVMRLVMSSAALLAGTTTGCQIHVEGPASLEDTKNRIVDVWQEMNEQARRDAAMRPPFETRYQENRRISINQGGQISEEHYKSKMESGPADRHNPFKHKKK